MPTIFRVTLPVTDLAAATRFYSVLLGDEGESGGPGWHLFRFTGATLACYDARAAGVGSGAQAHTGPVYIAVEETLAQLHYRAQSLGARHVDPEPHTLPTGEYGFLVRDPFGNNVYLVDERSVAWTQQHSAVAPATISQGRPETIGDSTTMSLQKDFINAVKGGDLETVKELLTLDPDLVDATDAVGVSALMHAAYKQQKDVADFLLESNPDLNLWEAAAFGRRERLEHLLDHGFRVNVFSADGFTPLGLACFFGYVDCVTLLLARGADPNAAARNDMMVQPLHSALARAPEASVTPIVRALIQAGANVNGTQQGGYVPLHQAADRGFLGVMKMLLAAGAQPNVRAGKGRTPLEMARARGHAEAMKLLSSPGS